MHPRLPGLLSIFTVGLASGCAMEGADPADTCDAAMAVLDRCGTTMDESPFGTCGGEQREQAASVLDVYDRGGCETLNEKKDDGPACLLVPFLCVEHAAAEIAEFTTDGCSMFPDGTWSDPTRWQYCCVTHDMAYFVGGTREQRVEADDALAQCIGEEISPRVGGVVRAGVRIGGTPALPTPWRWGYGWRYDPTDGYRDLPAEQLDTAIAALDAYRADPVPPHAFEQRARELIDAVRLVPGLEEAVDAVESEVEDAEDP